MALLKYFKKVESCEPSTHHVEPSHLPNQNQPKNKQDKKPRGSYMKVSPEDKATIGRYASEHGVTKAVKHFKEKGVKDSSVRDWMKAYNREVRQQFNSAVPGTSFEPVTSFPGKTRGRPPIIGKKLDDMLQEKIKRMREHQAAISSSVVVGVGRALVMKHDKMTLSDFGGPVQLNKEWARSVLRRMGFSKRRANFKSKLTPNDFTSVKETFLADIFSIVKMEEIPEQLIINWDHTAMKIVPSFSWTMEKRGTKRVEIDGIDDKRQIMAVFACSMAGKFLPLQLIYQGSTQKCLTKGVSFPDDWHLTYTSNHWSNEKTSIEYVKSIILTYVNNTRSQLGLGATYPALVLFDVFKGQCTDKVIEILQQNNIFYVLITPNCTNRLQPLDVSVNKPTKDFMKRQFQNWYASVILKQFDDGVDESVDMRLTIMKPLMANWIIELYQYFCSQPQLIVHGFGITSILK